MRAIRPTRLALVAAVMAAGTVMASAQEPARRAVTNENRLFQRFIEDGAVTEDFWFETQFRFQAFEEEEVYSIAPVLAVNVAEDLEFGGRFALATVDPDRGDSSTGFTDLELYGKLRLSTEPTQWALGVILELPTGDEQESLRLGNGEIDVSFFGGVRRDFGAVSLVGNLGLRINQDPDLDGLPAGTSVEGETSVQVGGAMLFALTRRLIGSIETSYETERIDGAGSDFRLTLGADYRWQEAFVLRMALASGAGDSAPNGEFIASGVFFF